MNISQLICTHLKNENIPTWTITQSRDKALVPMRVDLVPHHNKINHTGPRATGLEPLVESIHIVNYFQIIWGFFALAARIIGKLLHLNLEDFLIFIFLTTFSKKLIKMADQF